MSMTYIVTITSPDGNKTSFSCGGGSDQEALIYAGKIVEANVTDLDPDASVTILRDGTAIGTATTVKEITKTEPDPA